MNTGIAKLALAPAAAALVLGAGCHRQVGQFDNAGPDQRPEGAELIELEDGEGSDTDIVTYPGGDRVDWKKVELPEDFAGILQARLFVKPPREGLDVAFEIYDGSFERVAEADPPAGSGATLKQAAVKPAYAGTYYFHIYAPERTDAGEYHLAVRIEEADVSDLEDEDDEPVAGAIPDPPTLPAIPDEGDAVAQAESGNGNGNGGGSGNGSGGSDGGDPSSSGLGDDAEDEEEDEEEEDELEPLRARVVTYQMSSGGNLEITVNRGSSHGVERGWQAKIMAGSSERPINDGEFTITRVTRGEAAGEVAISIDQLSSNRQIMLYPPGYDGDDS